jgi:hypothetical protein
MQERVSSFNLTWLVWTQRRRLFFLIVDFESPNSSDARIPEKNVEHYAKWVDCTECEVPYMLITSLPKKPKAKWELRYTSSGGCNCGHKASADQIKSSPFYYWYGVYCEELKNLDTPYPRLRELPLYFANLDGLALQLIDVWDSATVSSRKELS